jgi:hypothetical protein
MTGAWLVAAMVATTLPSAPPNQVITIAGLAPAPDGVPAEMAPPHRRDWLFDATMAGVSGGNASDLTFTLYALHHGAAEGNPVLHPLGRHPIGLAAAKTGLTIGTMFALVKLHEHRPKLATTIAAGAAGVMLTVAAHNAGLLHRPR